MTQTVEKSTRLLPPNENPETERERTVTLSEIIEVLEGCSVFRELPEDEIRAIAALFRMESYDAGGIIFRQGDLGRRIYLIKEGQASLERKVNLGNSTATVTVSLLGRCRLLGCHSCLLGECGRLTETAVCQKPTQLISVEARELRAVFARNPQFAINLLKKLCYVLHDRLRGAYGAMDAL
jgi:CRP-like cAMP-binding protein